MVGEFHRRAALAFPRGRGRIEIGANIVHAGPGRLPNDWAESYV